MEQSERDSLSAIEIDDLPDALYRADNLPALEDVAEYRWKVLMNFQEERIGTIESIDIQAESTRVEFLQIGRGGFLGFGAERFLVPVTRIRRVDDKHVYIDLPLERLDGVPDYDYERVNDPAYCALVRAWWEACDAAPVPPVPDAGDDMPAA